MAKKPGLTSGTVNGDAAASEYASEADFGDTIARNRALPLMDPASVPRPPAGYRPTDPDMANRRMRRLSADHRSEACDALREAAGRDLTKDLGRHAPDPKKAPALLDRLVRAGQLLSSAQALLNYAREMDRLALSDAYLFLNAENELLETVLKYEPALATDYTALQKLFAARSDAIVEGMARAKESSTAQTPADKPPAK